jgi:hypothetical protein
MAASLKTVCNSRPTHSLSVPVRPSSCPRLTTDAKSSLTARIRNALHPALSRLRSASAV